MALGYLYIYFWQFLSISGNLWKLILCIHQWYKSFWDMNLSFFPLFWGYMLHFQPINLRKFNLKKKLQQFWKKTNHSHLDVPSPPISSPWFLFRNTIKIEQFHHFHPFFLRNSKNPNHSHLDLTLAHKMNIRFTKISQSPSRPSVRAWNTI